MGIIHIERRNFQDAQPVYEPWWDSVDDGTRIGIYVAIILLLALASGCIAWWVITSRRRTTVFTPQPAYTGIRPHGNMSWNEAPYKTLNGSKSSLGAYTIPQPPPKAYSYSYDYETDGTIQKDEIRSVLYKHDKA